MPHGPEQPRKQVAKGKEEQYICNHLIEIGTAEYREAVVPADGVPNGLEGCKEGDGLLAAGTHQHGKEDYREEVDACDQPQDGTLLRKLQQDDG